MERAERWMERAERWTFGEIDRLEAKLRGPSKLWWPGCLRRWDLFWSRIGREVAYDRQLFGATRGEVRSKARGAQVIFFADKPVSGEESSRHLGAPVPVRRWPPAGVMAEVTQPATYTAVNTVFEHKEYDTTNDCVKRGSRGLERRVARPSAPLRSAAVKAARRCCRYCPPGSLFTCFSIHQRLVLEPEEAVLIDSNCCATVNARRPYGELGSVDKVTSCGVCASFQFGDSSVAPGCGCSGDLVEEIVTELKVRMKARGDTGQIQRAEQQLQEIQVVKSQIANVDAKLNLILDHLKLDPPVPVAAVAMTERAKPE